MGKTNANDSIHNSEQGPQDGLTKREYFAAMAMQGYISAGSNGMPDPDAIAKLAVYTADQLIQLLNE